MYATRARQSYSGAQRSDPDRNPQHSAVQPPHPAAFPYHSPPSYPRFPPYDPYAAYHSPNPFYSPPYYAQHDVVKEEPAAWSWRSIVFLILLVIGALGIVYRSLSRETRRKIAAWLPLPRFPQQVIPRLDFISHPPVAKSVELISPHQEMPPNIKLITVTLRNL